MGNFREDLYYRLNVIEIYIPPLRSRKSDILPLIHFFLNEFNKKYNITRYFSETALSILVNYQWQGNVRELKHVVERLVVTTDTMVIDASMLPKNFFNIIDEIDDELPTKITSFDGILDDFEEKIVKKDQKGVPKGPCWVAFNCPLGTHTWYTQTHMYT